jgi:hypothetical protein
MNMEFDLRTVAKDSSSHHGLEGWTLPQRSSVPSTPARNGHPSHYFQSSGLRTPRCDIQHPIPPPPCDGSNQGRARLWTSSKSTRSISLY